MNRTLVYYTLLDAFSIEKQNKKRMIQKEQIQHRRQEIAEIRHADSVYRDIVARENEREDYEKRWFWELLQNAKDSINENESIRVKIEITENQISFSHTGNPFELDDILSLIIQGSSKNNKEGKTGRFGTGFLTTYLLSKEVCIEGKLTNDQGCFSFLLNRNAIDNEDFYRLQKESNEQFDSSIRENSYLDDSDFQTKFTYLLDEKGKLTANVGLECLNELIPITQLFNEQIESVSVIENDQIKTFTKSHLNNYEILENTISEWTINTVINQIPETTFKAYIQKKKKYDACIITHIVNGNETILPLSLNFPRLYFTFPLIGTEDIGIPIIINSTNFDPRVERDGVYLKKISENANESNNKEIIYEALLNCTLSFAELLKTKNIKGGFELFNFKISKDLKWVDHEWFVMIKNEILSQLATKSVIRIGKEENNYTYLNDLKIPYSSNYENTKDLWLLMSQIKKIKVPIKEDLSNWIIVTENIAKLKTEKNDPYQLDFVWGIKELINFTEQQKDFETLQKSLNIDVQSWLNNLYSIILKITITFPLDNKIVLNQENKLRTAEGMNWDKCNDDVLISISDLIELKFANRLISRIINPFHIVGVDDFTMQDAINELKSDLNDLDESDFTEPNLIKCNAKFLQWLISQQQKDIIKDLKVLTGVSKKNDENFVYDYFPKTEHLLLSPKPFFESLFPLFASVIREKDCLNETYNDFLISEDYKFLSDNGFIHYQPLVIKNDLANLKLLELLVINESDLNLLKDEDGQLKFKFKITYSDFAYLTATDGHIYGRNTTQKSSFDRFKFLLTEAVEKDSFFEIDRQDVTIEGLDNPIAFRQCLWVYRSKRLSWINVKTESENTETKFISETPSSKNLSELLKGDELLIKTIRGSKQQLLLNKLGVGVSDLIRNTLPNDELRLSWDKAITNMITSDVDPELVQEIFNDPNIRKEYEKRLNERKLISRNQTIGKLIEDLFHEYIEHLKESGFLISIERKPFGSDYIITEESSDLVNNNNEREGFKINNWLVELKASGKEFAAMTPLQAVTATENKDNYALIVVPLNGNDPDLEYVRVNAKVIHTIGHKINNIISDFKEVELEKSKLDKGIDGISVNIEDHNIRFRVSSFIWKTEQTNIESFIQTYFNETTIKSIIPTITN
ncbi:MAG: hypothetical protein PHT07_07440 [Paludibacter sp.]|nr:hypothetical protein [Paludibacter sp.]